jgi:hypothetical protein
MNLLNILTIIPFSIICLYACNNPHKAFNYEAIDKTICHSMITQNCGIYLYNCNSGNVYHCQTNVKEIK